MEKLLIFQSVVEGVEGQQRSGNERLIDEHSSKTNRKERITQTKMMHPTA